MDFRNWTIGKKLWLLAALSAMILIIIEVSSVVSTRRLTSKLRELSHAHLPAVRAMSLADMMHEGLSAVVYHSIVAAQLQSEEELKETKVEFESVAGDMKRYMNDILKAEIDAELKKQVTDTMTEVDHYITAGRSVITLASDKQAAKAHENLPTFQNAFRTLEVKLDQLGDRIESDSKASVTASETTAQDAELWGLLVGAIGTVVGLLMAAWFNRDLVQTVSRMVDRLSEQKSSLKNYTEEVFDSAETLSTSSTHQASAVQRTASAIEEINAMVVKTAENSVRLAESSKSSRDIVETGNSSVQQMLAAMENISSSNSQVMKQVEESNSQIRDIVRVIGEISEKTKVINDIVFQTKLLSFNASVEAARAGEHGKGFAVVAEEIGSLAHMSGTAAKEISAMLENGIQRVSEIVDTNSDRISGLMQDSAEKVETGRHVADRCGSVFMQIVDQVGEVSNLSSEISIAIQEQRAGLNEINQAIEMFNQSAHTSSTNAETSSTLAKNLHESFTDLNDVLSELETLVRGSSIGTIRAA